jgi:hypothetical protein
MLSPKELSEPMAVMLSGPAALSCQTIEQNDVGLERIRRTGRHDDKDASDTNKKGRSSRPAHFVER